MKIIALKEHKDGSATVTFDATQKEKELLMELGLISILKKATKKFYPAPNAALTGGEAVPVESTVMQEER